MLRIPGEEYISSCLVPLRRRYSTALKSFLPTPAFFWNSALQKSGELQFGFGFWRPMPSLSCHSETHLAYDLKFPLDSYFRHSEQCISRDLINWYLSWDLLLFQDLPQASFGFPADIFGTETRPLAGDLTVAPWMLTQWSAIDSDDLFARVGKINNREQQNRKMKLRPCLTSSVP